MAHRRISQGSHVNTAWPWDSTATTGQMPLGKSLHLSKPSISQRFSKLVGFDDLIMCDEIIHWFHEYLFFMQPFFVMATVIVLHSTVLPPLLLWWVLTASFFYGPVWSFLVSGSPYPPSFVQLWSDPQLQSHCREVGCHMAIAECSGEDTGTEWFWNPFGTWSLS